MKIQGVVLLVALVTVSAYTGNKLQTCEDTGEPFQVAYSNICHKACIQQCNDDVGSVDQCIDLPKYCEGFPAECGASGCECIPSSRLPGNPYSHESINDHVVERITCEYDVIKVHVSKCAVNEIGFKLSDFYINGIATSSHIPSIEEVVLATDINNTCVGLMEINENGLHYLFKVSRNLTACAGEMEFDEDKRTLIVSNAIRATATEKSSNNVTQRHALYIGFSCSYYTPPIMARSAVAVQPTAHEVKVYSGNLHGDFSITLDLWENTWHENHYVTAHEMMTNDYIYVTVGAAVNDSDRFNVQISEAWLSLTTALDDKISYPLIMNGCPVLDDHTTNGVIIESNGETLESRFKFRVFQLWHSPTDENQKVYLHVVAHLCDEIFEGECSLDCGGRRKREMEVPDGNTKNITSPPITVSKWRRMINSTGHNITVLDALNFITESWEITLMVGCILLLILTLMISMCILLFKLSSISNPDSPSEEK